MAADGVAIGVAAGDPVGSGSPAGANVTSTRSGSVRTQRMLAGIETFGASSCVPGPRPVTSTATEMSCASNC